MTSTSLCGLTKGLAVLVGLLIAGPTAGQIPDEISIPEPTVLQQAAAIDGAKTTVVDHLGKIESPDANASFELVDVHVPGGETVRGLKVRLDDAESSDEIYVTEDLLGHARDEFAGFEYTRQFERKCEAQYRCISGIARCRPSQTDRQAYCPGRYSSPEGDGGFMISTPRASFLFPEVESGEFEMLIAEAIQVLNNHTKRKEQ